MAEVIEGFAAADGALFVMDASAGVEAGLEQAVALGRSTGTAACFFINKCDRENADPTAALDALRATFGNKIAPLQLAIGAADSFSGYVDLVHRKAYRWDGPTEIEIPIPDELADEVARRRDQLLEAASEADDDVLAKYLEGEEVEDHELELCLRKGVKESVLAPVLVGSAAKGIGSRRCSTRSPLPPLPGRRGRRSRPSTRPAPRSSPADENGPLLVRVFKTTADPFVGRLTYLRVLSGTLRSQAHVWNTTRDEDERIGQLLLHGKEQEPIGELKAGEIGAVAKLAVTETGDTLATKEKPARACPARLPAAVAVVAIEPVSKQDLDKMGPALPRMLEEEPTVRLERTATGEQVLATMGEAHTAVILERLKRKFGAAIATHTPKVPYKETIRGKTQVHGRYKKQTGGHGMFGDVWIELEPNPEGGVEFAERIVGGSVPKGFFPASRRASARPRPRASSPATRCPTSRRRSTTGRSTRSTRTSCRSRSRPRWRSRTASSRPSRPSSSRSWSSRSACPRRTWARSTATSTAAAAASSGWTPTAACRSSRPTCRRRAVLLRHRAALARPGSGHVQRDAGPLRGRALPPRREGHRGAPQGAGAAGHGSGH